MIGIASGSVLSEVNLLVDPPACPLSKHNPASTGRRKHVNLVPLNLQASNDSHATQVELLHFCFPLDGILHSPRKFRGWVAQVFPKTYFLVI